MELFLTVFRMYVLFNVQLFIRSVEAQPTFTQTPSIPPVKEGENVTLIWTYNLDGTLELAQLRKVAANNTQKVIVNQYTTNNPTITNDFKDRFHVQIISNTETSVTITAIPRSDSGTYRYQITNNNFGFATSDVEISVLFPPSIHSYSGDQTLNEGLNLTLFCNATGKPTPNITWTRVWEDGTDSKGLFVGNTWTIVSINRTATGTYRCTADNGIGTPVNHTIYVNITYKPDTVTLESNTTENKDCSDLWVNFTCISSEANPPVYNYLLFGDEKTFSVSKSGTWIVNISKGGKVTYNCLAYQLVGNVLSENITLTVNVPPRIEKPTDKVVIEGGNLEVYCNVTGFPFPKPTVIWTKVKNGSDTFYGNLLNITNITRAQAGEYKCTANNTCGNTSEVANVDVHYPPSIINISPNITVNESGSVTLNCTADGNPQSYITWTNVSGDKVPSSFKISGKENEGYYRCTAQNGIGNQTTKEVFIFVEYHRPVKTVLTTTASNKAVIVGEAFSINCSAEANPPAKYRLYKDQVTINGNESVITTSVNERVTQVTYSCTSFNDFGEGPTTKITLEVLLVVQILYFTSTLERDGKSTLAERNETCKNYSTMACIETEHCIGKEVTGCGPGSIVVDFLLKFSQKVSASDVVSNLKRAAKESKFGSLTVDPKSIKQISSSPSTTEPTSTERTFTKGRECEESFFKESNCETKVTTITITFSVGGVVVVVVTIVIVWRVQKKRKCRKDTRVGNNSTTDVQPLSSHHSTLSEDNNYAKVNNGYAKSGPLPTGDNIDVEQPQGAVGAAAITTYAVVDKSKKKDKKKDKKASEQKPPEDQYAAVDKSKKKKKNEPDATYAEVDMSKKSKKPPKHKPDEVLYADLGNFHQMKEMPQVSTSPKALPPIKRPEPYAETQYADITQFLKGNPENTGTDSPKEGATLPDSNSSQTPAAGSKEESSAGNTGEGAKANEETLF